MLNRKSRDAKVHVFVISLRDAAMEITQKEAKSILTPQHTGALAARPYPFTHALSGYVGCGFGQTTCGLYSYAQFLPNCSFSRFTTPCGPPIPVETNAA